MEIDSIIFRTSPVKHLMKMILSSLIVSVIFAIYSLSLHDGGGIPFAEALLGKTLFLVSGIAIEAIIMIAIFLGWSYRTYEITGTELIFKTGILLRKEEIHSLKNIQSVYIQQGFLPALFRYGTVQLHNPLSREEVCIRDVSDPTKVAYIVQRLLSRLHDKTETIIAK